jgi:hypothetical protein
MIAGSLPFVESLDDIYVVEFEYVCENATICGVCSGRFEWIKGSFKEILAELFEGYSIDSCKIVNFKFQAAYDNDELVTKYAYNSA